MNIRYHSQARKEMAQFLPEKYSRVLEIGCGTANFKKNLKPCEYWGVEPNPEAAEAAATNSDNKILIGTYEQISNALPENYFDLVICNDVIEHMPDHDHFLQQIQKHMTPDGAIIGSIPNIRYFTSIFEIIFLKDFHYRESDIFDRTHQRFFTKKSIARSLLAAGLRIEKLQGINSFIFKKKNIMNIAISLTIIITIIASLFFFSDIRHMQYGFRASRK